MSLHKNILTLVKYKRWANQITFESLIALPQEEILKDRKTRFKNMAHTLNHVYIIDLVFKAHLQGLKHGYKSRNTENYPEIKNLYKLQRQVDKWYQDYVENISEKELMEEVKFNFIDGKSGKMSRCEIINHVVNHGTYHRGFVSDMMYQIPIVPESNDFSVFLNLNR